MDLLRFSIWCHILMTFTSLEVRFWPKIILQPQSIKSISVFDQNIPSCSIFHSLTLLLFLMILDDYVLNRSVRDGTLVMVKSEYYSFRRKKDKTGWTFKCQRTGSEQYLGGNIGWKGLREEGWPSANTRTILRRRSIQIENIEYSSRSLRLKRDLKDHLV